MPMRRAVLITRQAISPRFAIRIFLNMLSGDTFGRAPAAPAALGRPRITCSSYSKISRRQPHRHQGPAWLNACHGGGALARTGCSSAGISVEAPAGIGVGARLHQLGDLVLQVIIGDDQRADRCSQVAVTGRNGLVDRRVQSMVVNNRLSMRRHGFAPVAPLLFSFCSKESRPRHPALAAPCSRLWMKPSLPITTGVR